MTALVEHRSDNALRDRLVRAMEVWHDAGDFLVGAAEPDLLAALDRGGTFARPLAGVGPDEELFVVDLARVDVPAAFGAAARLVHAAGPQGLVVVPARTVAGPGELLPGPGLHARVARVRRQAWAVAAPGGRSGDPGQAFEGLRAWGNDLGLGGADGAYAADLEDWLRSPSVNCSNATNVTLTFRRWLSVDGALYDQAQLLVNGQLSWKNPSGTPLVDSSWVPVTIDISSLAAGNPSVRVEFRLRSIDTIGFGGWNLDAFELSERAPGSGGCLPPLSYCTPKLNSRLCLPVIESSGTPSASSAWPFLVTAVDVINNKAGVLFYGPGPASNPYQGGTLCVQGPVKRTPVQVSGGNLPPDDCSGSYSFDFNALIQSGGDPALVQGASVCGQSWYRDPGDFTGFGSGLTDALSFTICP